LSRFFISFTAGIDTVDTEFGIELAMSLLAIVACFGLVFENDYLFGFALGLDRSHDAGALNGGLTNGEFFIISDNQHAVQFYGSALGGLDAVNLDGLPLDDLILFPTGFNDSVNSDTSP